MNDSWDFGGTSIASCILHPGAKVTSQLAAIAVVVVASSHPCVCVRSCVCMYEQGGWKKKKAMRTDGRQNKYTCLELALVHVVRTRRYKWRFLEDSASLSFIPTLNGVYVVRTRRYKWSFLEDSVSVYTVCFCGFRQSHYLSWNKSYRGIVSKLKMLPL